MSKAKEGDRVRVHYTGRLEDESTFDSSEGGDPLEFTIGEGEIIPGFESAVVGMTPGESAETRIPPEKAYGKRRDDFVLTVERSELPDGMDPEVGEQLTMRTQDGQQFGVVIAEVADENVTLDANHPLAGKTLNFEIELVEIV